VGKDVDTAAEIQDVVDGVVAGNKIEDYADDSSNPTPTVADYEAAGVTGVTTDNLADVNAAVDAVVGTDVDTTEELQAIINDAVASVAAVNAIEEYADTNGTSEAPTAQTYEDAGVTIPDGTTVAEVNEAIAALVGKDVDTAPEIQDIVNGVVAGNKIEEYANTDGTSDTPTVADYEAVGVVGVTEENLAAVNTAVAGKEAVEVDTKAELQAIIDAEVPTAKAISVIEEYADTNGTSEAPIAGTYSQIGVTIPAGTTVDEVNEAIASLEGEDVDTAGEIQDVVDSIVAGNKIEDYADDESNPTPTVEDYIEAGVVGVTVDNLDFVNAAVEAVEGVDVDTTEELQAVINNAVSSVAAVDKIENYADTNGTSETPTLLDYAKAGVEDVSESIIAEVNEAIAALEGEDVDTAAEIQDVVDGVIAGNKIEDYADSDGSSEAPTVADYEEAGIVGVTEANLADVNAAVAAVDGVDVDTKEELQALINTEVASVAAVSAIEEYADTNGTSTPPTAQTYIDAGVTVPAGVTVAEINDAIAALEGEDVDTAAEIQDVIDSVVALNKIEDYADDEANPVPTLEDYIDAGVVGVTSDNLADVNVAVAAVEGEDVDTLPELQALVNSEVASVASMDTIVTYAETNGTSTDPVEQNYTDIGVTIPATTTVAEVNEAIAALEGEDVDTVAEIQDVVDGLASANIIEDYAQTDGGSTPVPTEEDYENVGVTIPDTISVDDLNEVIATLDPEDVDTAEEIEDIIDQVVQDVAVDTIEEYANTSGGSTEPTTTDYENAGVDGVTDGNIAEINGVVAGLNPEDVDTAVEIQAIVDGVVALNVIEDYADDATNPTPTVNDYIEAGVVGVTADNLDAVNTAVEARVGEDVDTVDELQAIINGIVPSVNAIDTIESYAQSDGTTTAPTTTDYANAGVDGVTDTNVAEINDAIAAVDGEDADTAVEVQDIVDGVVAGNKIEDYAENESNPTPSVEDYVDAGVVGVTEDNLDAVNAAVAAVDRADVDTTDELQDVINDAVASVAAVSTIEEYAQTDGGSTPPSTQTYIDAGVTIPEGTTVAEVNEAIAALESEDVDTAPEIQDVIDSVVALNKIEDYADNESNPTPTVSDYDDAGVVRVTVDNLEAVNAAVAAVEGTDVDTLPELQAIINAAVESVDAINTITEYAETDGTSEDPTTQDYANIGITIPEGTTVDEVNDIIAGLEVEDVDTPSEIQDIIDSVVALNKIEDYADDETNPTPTVADYEEAGVVGVTVDNLADVNAAVAAVEGVDVDTPEELQAIIDGAVDSVEAVSTIVDYADTNGTSTPPTVQNYVDAGVDGVDDNNINEVNEIVAGLDPEDVDTPSEIQDVVDAVNAGNKIEDYAHDDTTNPTPTVEDYADAGVVGVTADNLAAVNTAVAAVEREDVDTVEELQAVINAAVESVAAVSTIEEYADSNGTSETPDTTDYSKAGVDGVDANNIDEVNEAIAALDGEDVDTAAEIQDVVDGVVAGNKIEDYADNESNPTPTVADYEDAGVTGVTVDNLDAVNAAVAAVEGDDVDTTEELQAVINNAVESVAAVSQIEEYAASNGTSEAPTTNTYAKAGVDGVDANNIDDVNDAIAALNPEDVDTAVEVQEIVQAVNALNKIEDYADDANNATPTVSDYITAGVVGVTVDNLVAVNAAVDAVVGVDVDTVEELQAVIDAVVPSVNAVSKIEEYAETNGTSATPTIDDFTRAGVDGVDGDNLAEVNDAIAALDGEDVDTAAEIQDVVDGVVAGNKIEDYADNESNPTPTVADYEDAGVTGVTADNLDEVNAAVAAVEGTDVDTTEELQAVINDAVGSVAAVNKIEEYAESNGTSATPTSTDYEDAGVTIPTGTSVEEVNEAIAALDGEDVDTAAEVQNVVDAIAAGNKIENYADDESNPTPLVSDYTTAGVTGVTVDNIDAVNAAVAAVEGVDVDTIPELQAVINGAVESAGAINTIIYYADSNGTTTAPSVSDYVKSGVDGVTTQNVEEVNEAIAALVGEDVDTGAEIQDIVDGVNALNKIEDYADDSNNETPSVSDYINAGVVGVTAENLADVNSAVEAVIGENVDTVEELQAIVSAAVDSVEAVETIANYAESNGTSETPELSDYTNANIDDVTADNIAEINERIADLDREDVDSVNEIQAVVDAVVALDKIEDYADDTSNPVPTVSDYITAGVVGVTTDNLEAVNAAVEAVVGDDVDTIPELQAVINGAVSSVNALDTVATYAETNGTSEVPTAQTYSDLNLTIPSNTTVAEVNEAIAAVEREDANTIAEIEDIITAVSALNTVEDYADDNLNTIPTVQDYTNAGVVGVTADNIDEVNAAVDALLGDDVDTVEELQAVIDGAVSSVVAVNTIATYAETNGTSTTPTVDTYANAGISIPSTTTVEELNERIAGLEREDVDSVEEIQGVLDAVDALNKIEAYADDNTNPVPTVEDYQTAGIIGVRADNITTINNAIDNATAPEADTVEEVQAIVNAADAKAAALAKIAAYMQDSEINPAPTVSDYNDVGVTGVTEHNLGSVNQMIDDAICSM
jgi:hypothetical protein